MIPLPDVGDRSYATKVWQCGSVSNTSGFNVKISFYLRSKKILTDQLSEGSSSFGSD